MKTVADMPPRQLAAHISGQSHAMAGATIALSAALGVALGEACVRISAGLAGLDAPAADWLQVAQQNLLDLADEDANAIARFAALRDAGDELAGQDYLCELPGRMGQFAVEAAQALQNFRPLVHERVRDDLEMAITLLAGASRAAMLLLDSNLRIWPQAALIDKYEPLLATLEQAVAALTPPVRLR
jgi:formiminotetrahydrofolate cyclodeaminase